MNDDLHIASFVVQHRPEAWPTLEAYVAAHAGLEVAARNDTRCVLLCESEDQRALMDGIDAIQVLPGVITVALVYHHAEPRAALEQPAREVSEGVSP